jgi:hypothetical protein
MEPPRLQVLVAAFPGFAEFQILPCLFLLAKHATVVVAGPDRLSHNSSASTYRSGSITCAEVTHDHAGFHATFY